MKPVYRSISIVAMLLFLFSLSMSAQKGARKGGHRHHPHKGGKVVVVKRSPFRPKKVVVYHPVWGPKYHIHRRWVFFPKYNFYWDNWRNSYMFWNGTIWIVNTSPPPTVINVNLENEKHYELKENDEDIDDVYKNNDSHKEEYKPE